MRSDSLKEKEARLHYLQGRLNAQQSEREAMARLLAYLRGAAPFPSDTVPNVLSRAFSDSISLSVAPLPGVHVPDVPERGNDEDLRNALITSLMGDSEDEQALSELQALTNGQLLDKVGALKVLKRTICGGRIVPRLSMETLILLITPLAVKTSTGARPGTGALARRDLNNSQKRFTYVATSIVQYTAARGLAQS
jgi:hypothetical protein